MDLSKVAIGDKPPIEVNVVIEVPLRSDPIKYEFEKDSGAIFVDRFPLHDDVLSVQLRVHPPHAGGGWRSR